MSASLFVLLGSLSLSSLHHESHVTTTDNATYHDFPKFWTNSGLCPAGELTHESIRGQLLSDAMQMNLLHLSVLPAGALTHLRIHWALELLEFIQFAQSGLPIYDFSDLNDFLGVLDDLLLYPVIEFMGNFSEVFTKNPTYNDVLWEDLAYQVTKHYLNVFGAKKLLNWRFELWNEPDLRVYNKLNFTLEAYLVYAKSIEEGLKKAGMRSTGDLHIPLRGPAGLFKAQTHHPLCWGVLEYCNENITQCPFDVLTYHRKGNGSDSAATVILEDSQMLLHTIYNTYPELRKLPVSNDEADPIAGWSTARDFQEDVRYAVSMVNIILKHWSAKLQNKELANLESISHDNAFLSYHPNEFSQRTLLAHFRMNNTNPPHSQFIQKPVYAAMGLMSRLAELASDVEEIEPEKGLKCKILKTMQKSSQPLYLGWLLLPVNEFGSCEANNGCHNTSLKLAGLPLCHNEVYAFIIEILDQRQTNPVDIWHLHHSPCFPNPTLRSEMRRHQTLHIHSMGVLENPNVEVNFKVLSPPWLMLLRICSNLNSRLSTPHELQVTAVTHNEVLITWREMDAFSLHCLKSYEVWFKAANSAMWSYISFKWHLPFPSFQYAPVDEQKVNGFYKIRSTDIFNRTSSFSPIIEYIEI